MARETFITHTILDKTEVDSLYHNYEETARKEMLMEVGLAYATKYAKFKIEYEYFNFKAGCIDRYSTIQDSPWLEYISKIITCTL